jgi:hypothetical protein
MSDRRYNDEEVAEIFARVSDTERETHRHLPSREGLTLSEVQQIGREAGIASDLVAQAARSLDQPPQPERPVVLGLPIGAARTVRLERRMTEDEWERLVVDLRETFAARGTVRAEGSLRQWSNGNLQVLLEPDGDSQRVRFRTIRGNARPLMFLGLGLVGVSVATLLAAVTTGAMPIREALASVATMGLGGAAVFSFAAIPLPRWARLRQQQMDALAERLMASLAVKQIPRGHE